MLIFLLFIFHSFVFAEENPASESLKPLQEYSIPKEQSLEKITVVGSRIKRIDLEGPNPVTIFTEEDLENSGYINFSEFLSNTSLSNFGYTYGHNAIHNGSTLVLINGTRTVHDSSLDLVPLSAIERVEVLKDGASALYGSDVVGGVINIITKKGLRTSKVSLKLAPPFYPSYKWSNSPIDASFVFTRDFGRGYLISTFQTQYTGLIKVTDRPSKWFKADFSDLSTYPTFQTKGGGFIIDPRCPKELKEEKHCEYNLLPYEYLEQGLYSFSNYNYMEYKLGSNLLFYTQWIGSLKRLTSPDGLISGELEIPSGHKMSLGQGLEGTLKYRFKELSHKDINVTIFLEGLLGFKTWLSKTWDLDFSLKWSNHWHNRKYTGYPYLKDIKEAIYTGIYDPFDPSKRDLSSVQLHDATWNDSHDMKIFSSLDLSGELAFLDMDVAVGLQAYSDRYKSVTDPIIKAGKIFGLKRTDPLIYTQQRHVVAGYLEGIKTFSDFLELQLAGRVDRYFDFGWTANPKLALLFRPLPQFLIRSSVGTSFEAPSLSDLLRPPTQAFSRSIFDTVACYNELKHNNHFQPIYDNLNNEFDTQEKKDEIIKEFLIEQSSIIENENLSENAKVAFKELADQLGEQDYCQRRAVKGIDQGNKNLKETRALTASLGFHWQIYKDHSLTVDYWRNSLKGNPSSSFRSKQTIDAELRYGKKYVEEQGIQYERDSTHPHNTIKNPIFQPINIGKSHMSGLDLSWRSSFSNWNVAGGFFYFQNDFAYILKSGAENFPGMGFVSNLGKISRPKWRNFATLGWRNSKHNISLVLKNTDSVKKYFNEFESIPVVSLLDLFYQYVLNEKTSFKAGAYNVLFSDPVVDDTIGFGPVFDSSFYSVRNPHFFMEIKHFL